jgi:hypothetical protein
MDCLSWLRTQWDRALAWSLVALGAVLVVAGGLQSRAAWTVADQLSFMLSAGLGGTLAIATGATLLVSAGLRDEWRRLHRQAAPPTTVTPTAPGANREWCGPLGWALFAVAAVVLVAGSRGSATAASDPEQVAFLISGGVGALLLALVGAALVVSTELRSVAGELARLRRNPAANPAPARRRNSVLATVIVALTGAVIIGLGWARAAGTVRMQTALDGLALAAAGLALAALTLAAVGIRLRQAVSRELAIVPVEDAGTVRLEHRPSAVRSANGFYTVHGLGRFHRPSCPALSSTGGERQPVARAGTGLEPCLLCVEEVT